MTARRHLGTAIAAGLLAAIALTGCDRHLVGAGQPITPTTPVTSTAAAGTDAQPTAVGVAATSAATTSHPKAPSTAATPAPSAGAASAQQSAALSSVANDLRGIDAGTGQAATDMSAAASAQAQTDGP